MLLMYVQIAYGKYLIKATTRKKQKHNISLDCKR